MSQSSSETPSEQIPPTPTDDATPAADATAPAVAAPAGPPSNPTADVFASLGAVRLVKYALDTGPKRGKPRAAIVVCDPEETAGEGYAAGEIDLLVLTRGPLDSSEHGYGSGIVLRRRVPYSADGAPGSWRWPERRG